MDTRVSELWCEENKSTSSQSLDATRMRTKDKNSCENKFLHSRL